MAYIRIVRPFNFLFVVIAVLFGVFYRGVTYSLLFPILAGIAAALISGGGYTINDYYDYQIDLINRRERVLPSASMSPSTARLYAIILFTLGILIAIYLQNFWMIVLAIVNTLLLYLYAMKGKRLHIWGNLLVAFVTASTFIFGSFLLNNFRNALFVSLCAFFYTLIRELIKDIEDINGDISNGSKTIPIICGNKKTILLSFLFWVFLSVVIILAYPSFYSFSFFIIILIGILLLLLIDIVMLYITQDEKLIKFSERFMKIHMLIFLVLLWVAQ